MRSTDNFRCNRERKRVATTIGEGAERGYWGPASDRAGAKAKGRSACDLYQLNILQTVVFSDHTHAVCMKHHVGVRGARCFGAWC